MTGVLCVEHFISKPLALIQSWFSLTTSTLHIGCAFKLFISTSLSIVVYVFLILYPSQVSILEILIRILCFHTAFFIAISLNSHKNR